MKNLRKFWLFFSAVVLVTGIVVTISAFNASQNFRALSNESSMTISGTSTLHDWTVTLNQFNCAMTAFFDASQMKIENVIFRGRSGSITSDNRGMDKRMHEAMKVNQHQEVSFRINSTRDVTLNNNRFSGIINGTLTIAGSSRTENIQFTGQMVSQDRIRIRGSKKLKMSDFGISPPTAMMGAVRSGDEVTVSFNLLMAVN